MMADEQQPYSWIGQAVVVYRPRADYPLYGTLEAVNDSGIVVRSSVSVSWGESEGGAYYGYENSEERALPQFHPWHTVGVLRPLEPEEREERGLD